MTPRKFESMAAIHAKLEKASELHLPEDERRQAIAHVERLLGRELTTAESDRFAQVAKLAPQMVPGRLTAAEERAIDGRMASFSVTAKPSMPGIKGGQGRAGIEVERDAHALLTVLGMVAAALLGIGIAELIATAADTAGRLLSPLFF